MEAGEGRTSSPFRAVLPSGGPRSAARSAGSGVGYGPGVCARRAALDGKLTQDARRGGGAGFQRESAGRGEGQGGREARA